jgi:hypothetical protein
MKELLKKLATIPNDKLLHFFYGSLIGFVCLYFGLNTLLSSIIVLSIATAKEFYDKNLTGFDVVDLLFTVAPLILYIILIK